ncbi:MAG: nitroreductase family protein [Spirochaetales bacterium]|nr:nitroreductase family protein [Spirochaetales bacterium]
MILAAADRGLQSCWVNRFDPEEVASALGLGPNERVLMLMDIGYAAEGGGPSVNHEKRKPLSETMTML